MFSDALGVKVDTAPGVNTAGDTRQLLPEGLYVHIAWEPDPNDPSVFTVQPDDVEILEAYANASLAYYRALIDHEYRRSDDFEPYMIDGRRAVSKQQFEEARGAASSVRLAAASCCGHTYWATNGRTRRQQSFSTATSRDEQYFLRDGRTPCSAR